MPKNWGLFLDKPIDYSYTGRSVWDEYVNLDSSGNKSRNDGHFDDYFGEMAAHRRRVFFFLVSHVPSKSGSGGFSQKREQEKLR